MLPWIFKDKITLKPIVQAQPIYSLALQDNFEQLTATCFDKNPLCFGD